MKIFVIDFSTSEEWLEQLPANHDISVEREDGGRAYKTVGELLPDLILVNYAHKPSHCRQTVQAVRERKKTRDIPVMFVGGSPEQNAKLGDLGKVCAWEELPGIFK